ncbi:conserved hypothetical protein [Paenibacillus curdlanolyticus YK9]|uniref:Uncharacterized protein n=1 Tax=Paenibacillus curdlanolyticus YK9 TaxID=717606 RepID=E0IFC6_9BACL|nr:hypothetical protein [Paenibacillus curdlanolyticus]EFM08902.1 conserved hypothetical protein [Paenibacillus curdlanolyticus YK9]
MDIDTVFEHFIISSIKHGEATEQGNYKVTNKEYKKIEKLSAALLSDIQLFSSLLVHENPYVRLAAGSYLIRVEQVKNKAITVLEDLQIERGFLGFNAKMVLQEMV